MLGTAEPRRPSAPLGSKAGAGSVGGGGPGPHGDQVRHADTSPGHSCTLPSWRLMANADCPCVPRGRSSFSDQGIPWVSPPSEGAGVGLQSSPWEGACVCPVEASHGRHPGPPLPPWLFLPMALLESCCFCSRDL